ncbi:2Fe-2S iron-sulfur cluster-binding protein, partial [Cypionkella sp.]|uniref:2Fe-2S iron-sulfur cluster-binding protein n=1 Tax=Cypionkella sp. TaxID=2811411 RepID=UPI002602A9BB
MMSATQAWRRVARRWWRRLRPSLTQLRLWSGLVLFAFATAHLCNHALGLISLEAMQAAQDMRLALTRSLLGTVVLCTAALLHFCLGLWQFVKLRMWRLGIRGAVQLLFGLLIPVLLTRHVLGTRGAHELYGVTDSYAYALWAMWPNEAVRLALLVALVWIHGCLGLHMWLSPKPWYRRHLWAFYGLAVLIPSMGYAGYVAAGRLQRQLGGISSPFTPDQYEGLQQQLGFWADAYYAILAAAVAVWLLLLLGNKFGARITVRYYNGPTVTAPRGLSILEVSLQNRIPHAAVCGGRARCSTCRVRVIEGLDQLPPPSLAELQVLRRVG